MKTSSSMYPSCNIYINFSYWYYFHDDLQLIYSIYWLSLFQRRCPRSRFRHRRTMVGRHGVLESSLLHAGQETGRTRGGPHKGGGRGYLQVSRRFPDRANEKLQSQFNGDRWVLFFSLRDEISSTLSNWWNFFNIFDISLCMSIITILN